MKTILLILGASLSFGTGLAAAEPQPTAPPLEEAAAKLQIQYETTLAALKGRYNRWPAALFRPFKATNFSGFRNPGA